MSTSLMPTSLLGSLGLPILEDALNAAFGEGVFTLSADSSGVSAGLTLSGGLSLNIENLTVNAQGISGRFSIDGLSETNTLGATIAGFKVGLTAFDITLAQSGLAASNIGAQLTIPFFTDSDGNAQVIDVEVSTNAAGNLTISVAAAPSQSTTADGLVQLSYELSGVGSVEIDVDSLEITQVNGVWTLVISGNLVIDTDELGLSWPSIELKGLGIDSKGNISLEGGWIDLPNQLSLNFYGFSVGLQKLGFGSDASGDKWIGFNGDINLVEGLTLGASVRGLQINITNPGVTLEGVSIDFAIPGVLSISGEVDHFQVPHAMQPSDLVNAGLPGYIFDFIAPPGPAPQPNGKQVNVFAGAVDLNIEVAEGLEVDANFLVGNFGGQSVFFLDVDAELPVGIPLFLDVGLYGLQGLVATGLEPEPGPQNTWWEWFKYPAVGEPNGGTGGNGSVPPKGQTGIVNTGGTPNYSATDFYKWLYPQAGAFALGAGATIGTEADDGYTVSAAILFLLMLPGPVISLIGKANILSPRIGAASDDADFDAMATYDGNSGTFDLTVDAQYSIPVVLDITATAELFVGPDPSTNEEWWYFALGKPPHEQRVSARIFDIFEADAYFVVSDQGLVTGTWTGFNQSWSFGPLSASVDAYLATLAAIQWAPLQIAGGIELYGNVQLGAFGIHVGLTADALLEGCAPNPFWVHGELSVQLNLPWPLPNLGATISLTWGGDNGTVPPAPLALSKLNATLMDHCDAGGHPASDHYLLMSHATPEVDSDLTVVLDPTTPGILQPTKVTGRTLTTPPDLIPTASPAGQFAPVLPQDAHFTLLFAQATCDKTGAFGNVLQPGSAGFAVLPPAPSLPPATLVGADDMSNINPTPPLVQFVIQHTLLEVALYLFDAESSSWNPVCSTQTPAVSNPTEGVTQLSGVWLAAETGSGNMGNARQAMTQLKVVPWSVLPGVYGTAQWSGESEIEASGATFEDQGLEFEAAAGIHTASIGGVASLAPGLLFTTTGTAENPAVTIAFGQAVILTSLVGMVDAGSGEIEVLRAPQCVAGGVVLTPQSSTQDPNSGAWMLMFAADGPAITEFSIAVAGSALILYSIDWVTAAVPMAILPQAPGFYALATVTMIEAARAGTSSFQAVPNGDPIVEFAYFQTASGPGTVQGAASAAPSPVTAAPYPQLEQNCAAAVQPSSASPLGGALTDLDTYTQWSWPLDGAMAAYYGYDVNVEFVESYVNALYTAYSAGNPDLSLHFRCVDRNNNHVLLVPDAIHVPSIPQQGALVAYAEDLPLPSYIPETPVAVPPWLIDSQQQAWLTARAAQAVNASVLAASAPVFTQPSLSKLIAEAKLTGRNGELAIQQINPGLAGEILQAIAEYNAGQQAEQLWFRAFAPSTRYTLDVVAGPLSFKGDVVRSNKPVPGEGPLAAVQSATDAIGLLAALQNYFAYEDALTTLKRVQFTTSRYATFTAHLANAASQLEGGSGATPIRNYAAAQDPIAWLGTQTAELTAWATAGGQYLSDETKLAALVANFDPMADDLGAGNATVSNGASALVGDRQTVAADWSAFTQATNTLYNGLITALGYPEMAANQAPISVPDTEISLFTDGSGEWIEAILIQSPEALPWQRIWRWIRLTSPGGDSIVLLPVWSEDGTMGVLLPFESARGFYSLSMVFHGDLGAEAPCITEDAVAVTEGVVVGSIRMGPPLIRPPRGKEPVAAPQRPVLAQASQVRSIVQV